MAIDPKKELEEIRSRRARRRRARIVRRIGTLVGAVVLVFAYLAYAPDNYDLTAPLDLTDTPTFVTELKIRLGGVERCYEALGRAGIEFERLPDEVKGPGCELEGVARLDRSLIAWGDGVTLRCPMLAGVSMWERHELQPAAREIFGSPVTRIQHFGTYSCRNVNNSRHGRRSEHASANAVDVAGFVLADGRRISVLEHWGQRTPEGRFLDRAHSAACSRFDTVLGPDYNELHRDHFHFDNGGFDTCR